MTPDHNALVGEADGSSRFLYATGFSGHGFLMGPAIGEVMRDLYLGRQPVVDVSALTRRRFAGARPAPRAQHRLATTPKPTKEPPMTDTMHQIPSSATSDRGALATAAAAASTLARSPATWRRRSPVNGEPLAAARWVDGAAVDDAVERAQAAFLQWRTVPAPARGALVKRLGELLASTRTTSPP